MNGIQTRQFTQFPRSIIRKNVLVRFILCVRHLTVNLEYNVHSRVIFNPNNAPPHNDC